MSTYADRLQSLREQLRQSAEAAHLAMAEAALRFVLDTPGGDSLIVAPRRIEQFASLGLEER
jgi:aryl-alcohol dehydrogenase-like predicted oxidoreductase